MAGDSKLFRPALLSISLLTIMAGAAVSPALGEISAAFPDAPATLIQLVATLPSLVIIAASLAAGLLARRFSKRSLLFAGLLIYAVGGMGGGLANSIGVLLLFRGILGLGVGIISPLSVTLIADFFRGEPRARYMGYSTSVSNLAGAATTLLGGWLAAINWRYAFTVYALSLGVLALVAVGLPEPPEASRTRRRSVRLPWSVYGLATLVFLEMLGFYIVPATLAIFMQDQAIGEAQASGLVFAALTLATFLVGLVFGRIRSALGAWTPLLGVAALGGGFWLLSGAAGLAAVLVSAALMGLGIGLLHPSLLTATADQVSQERHSVALSVFNSATYLGQFLSPLWFAALGGLLGGASPRLSFWLSALGFSLALALGLGWRLWRSRRTG